MISRTHDLAAFTALNIVIITQPLPLIPFSTAITALCACFLGGLLPDIDVPTSGFWQRIPIGTYFGQLLHPFFGAHRHLTHSLLGIFLAGLFAKLILGLASTTILVNMDFVWIGFMIGLSSHMLMDILTVEGVPLFFPFHFNFGFPPFKFLRIKTGGLIEKILIFPGLLFFNIYLIYNYYPVNIKLFKMFLK